jgi:hypothetical protein
MTMDLHETAFKYAGETVRQVLTLATGVIALTVTFAKDIIEPGSAALPWMNWGWTLFGISIFFGILTLMAIAGQLHEAAAKNPPGKPNIYATNIRLFANLQIWLCFAGLILTIIFGIIGINERQHKATSSPPAVAVTCPPCPTNPPATTPSQDAPSPAQQPASAPIQPPITRTMT